MKTSELKGTALDWAVAKCEPDDTLAIYFEEDMGEPLCHDDWESNQEYKPSTDWAQGGAIIEREMIELVPQSDSLWDAMYRGQHIPNDGPTPLIAAMRCYVASKLGDEIEIPKELCHASN